MVPLCYRGYLFIWCTLNILYQYFLDQWRFTLEVPEYIAMWNFCLFSQNYFVWRFLSDSFYYFCWPSFFRKQKFYWSDPGLIHRPMNLKSNVVPMCYRGYLFIVLQLIHTISGIHYNDIKNRNMCFPCLEGPKVFGNVEYLSFQWKDFCLEIPKCLFLSFFWQRLFIFYETKILLPQPGFDPLTYGFEAQCGTNVLSGMATSLLYIHTCYACATVVHYSGPGAI